MRINAPNLVNCRQLRAARVLAGLTQKTLGAALDVDERQIRFWERRIPTSANKRAAIIVALEAHGVMLTSHPIVGVVQVV